MRRGKFASKHLRRGARHASDASKEYPAQTDGRTVSGMQAWRGSPPRGIFFVVTASPCCRAPKSNFPITIGLEKAFGCRPHVTAAGLMSRQQVGAKSRQGGHRTSSWSRVSSQQEQPGSVRARFLARHGSRAKKVPQISPSRFIMSGVTAGGAEPTAGAGATGSSSSSQTASDS